VLARVNTADLTRARTASCMPSLWSLGWPTTLLASLAAVRACNPMSSPEQLTDAELVARCRVGQQSAWNTLVRRYERLVFTVPRRAGLSEEQAADVFQVVFSRLFEHLDKLADPSRVHAWLVTTAKRESLRVLELSRRVVDLATTGDRNDGTDPLDRFASTLPLPEELLVDLQQQHLLTRAVAQLDERSRRFVELLFLQDEPLPYAEIAARLGIAEGSIGPTRARCLDKLRAILRHM
jgi:RNA polymerase sigma factor (sigma-70 family)